MLSLIPKFPFIGDYVGIVGSIINALRPSLASDSDKDIEISQKMLEKSKLVINPLKEMFAKSGKRILSNKMKKKWTRALHCQIFQY